jgi:hypothetical protein
MRLIQIRHINGARRVGLVDGDQIALLDGTASIYDLANQAVAAGEHLTAAAQKCASAQRLAYDSIYDGHADWRILPAIDHPYEPARCLVSGTGLTHFKSAHNRQAMHAANAEPTDSMRMYQWGVEGGRPAPGQIGISPEWFYKGNGTILRAHGEPLDVPAHAEDGGEEPEIAGAYIIDATGTPRRAGLTMGNEFSDHVFERRNYLYLAASKLMSCAIGPELALEPEFQSVSGEVVVERKSTGLWRRELRSGEAVMSHSLANIEHHHFKHAAHRRPGDVHVHYFGADAFSFGEGITLQSGDVMQVQFAGFGRPLRTPVIVETAEVKLFAASPL